MVFLQEELYAVFEVSVKIWFVYMYIKSYIVSFI